MKKIMLFVLLITQYNFIATTVSAMKDAQRIAAAVFYRFVLSLQKDETLNSAFKPEILSVGTKARKRAMKELYKPTQWSKKLSAPSQSKQFGLKQLRRSGK